MSVIDALGIEASVGDEVLFGQAGKGAQELLKGFVTKINEKTVSIERQKTGSRFNKYAEGGFEKYQYSVIDTRKNKCFVIISYAE